MREDVEKKEGRFLICLGKKSTQERERGDCSQGSSGTVLVILGILTHVRFLHVFVSKYLIYC